MTPTDTEALTRAIEFCRAENAGRRQQIDSKLQDEPWERVARFAAYCSQTRTLHLEPWETPPVWIGDIDAALNAPDDARYIPSAAELLQRLLALGLSRYEPNPLAAIDAAEQRQAAK